jgi:NAD(P)-dependent dehydrogenase (short-subunit alcohol dehydrogenase family)
MEVSKLMYPTVAVGAAVTGLIVLRRYFGGGVCHSQKTLDGKTVIITGANTGIGLETSIDLAKRNARIIMACRDKQRGMKACSEAKQRSGSDNIVFHQLDLADMKSVQSFAAKVLEEEPHIHILINNAGVMMCPYSKTKDGFEMQFGVNHLGHFLLTSLLLDRLKQDAPSRIINVSSLAHEYGAMNFDDLMSEKSYNRFSAYSQSKLANVLFSRELAKRLEGTSVTVCSLHPGSVRTELARHVTSSLWLGIVYVLAYPFFMISSKSAWQGAQTNIYCAVAEELEGVSGLYYSDCAEKKLKPHALDDAVAKKLWEVSEQLTEVNSEE